MASLIYGVKALHCLAHQNFLLSLQSDFLPCICLFSPTFVLSFCFQSISFWCSIFQVPELFYLPEILTNENSIDFGTTQLGGKLGM